MTNISVKTIKDIKEKTEKILALLGVKGRVSVSAQESKIRVSVESPDKALLIGWRGENLFALRYMLAIMFREIMPEKTSLVLDVGGYLRDKEKRIEKMVDDAAKKVKDTGMEEMLPPMNSYERMLAHQRASNITGVSSYSEGSGPARRIFITKKR